MLGGIQQYCGNQIPDRATAIFQTTFRAIHISLQAIAVHIINIAFGMFGWGCIISGNGYFSIHLARHHISGGCLADKNQKH